MESQPPNKMDAIVAARYAPLVLPHPLKALPGGDYHKYIPRFNGQGEITTEEHWNAYYSYVDNQNIENRDVWMQLFVQSLDGEVMKWLREFPQNSIYGIKTLEEFFMRQWGDTNIIFTTLLSLEL